MNSNFFQLNDLWREAKSSVFLASISSAVIAILGSMYVHFFLPTSYRAELEVRTLNEEPAHLYVLEKRIASQYWGEALLQSLQKSGHLGESAIEALSAPSFLSARDKGEPNPNLPNVTIRGFTDLKSGVITIVAKTALLEPESDLLQNVIIQTINQPLPEFEKNFTDETARAYKLFNDYARTHLDLLFQLNQSTIAISKLGIPELGAVVQDTPACYQPNAKLSCSSALNLGRLVVSINEQVGRGKMSQNDLAAAKTEISNATAIANLIDARFSEIRPTLDRLSKIHGRTVSIEGSNAHLRWKRQSSLLPVVISLEIIGMFFYLCYLLLKMSRRDALA